MHSSTKYWSNSNQMQKDNPITLQLSISIIQTKDSIEIELSEINNSGAGDGGGLTVRREGLGGVDLYRCD